MCRRFLFGVMRALCRDYRTEERDAKLRRKREQRAIRRLLDRSAG